MARKPIPIYEVMKRGIAADLHPAELQRILGQVKIYPQREPLPQPKKKKRNTH